MAAHEELLDARGLVCPEPVRLAQLRMADLPPGAVLLVLATDPAAPIDFETWCDTGRHSFLGSVAADGIWRIRIRRSTG